MKLMILLVFCCITTCRGQPGGDDDPNNRQPEGAMGGPADDPSNPNYRPPRRDSIDYDNIPIQNIHILPDGSREIVYFSIWLGDNIDDLLPYLYNLAAYSRTRRQILILDVQSYDFVTREITRHHTDSQLELRMDIEFLNAATTRNKDSDINLYLQHYSNLKTIKGTESMRADILKMAFFF